MTDRLFRRPWRWLAAFALGASAAAAWAGNTAPATQSCAAGGLPKALDALLAEALSAEGGRLTASGFLERLREMHPGSSPESPLGSPVSSSKEAA